VLFLDGRADEVIRRVRDRMEDAAVSLDFERAAELRDALRHLERMEEPSVVLEVEGGDRDVVGYARDGDDACVAILRIRRGKLLGRDHRFVENIDGEDDAAVLSAYLARTYVTSDERADELLVPFDFEDRDAIEASAQGTRVVVPQRGPRRELVDLAQQNARHLLEELKLATLESEERATSPVYELGRALGLQRLPRSLVCFDISTAQGTDTVGSCVWFENGRPRRAEYRKFKVKTVVGTDDFASMREVVGRYFRRRLEEQKPLPDLVVIDGGKGQLGAAADALRELNLDTMQLISLAKREEEIFVIGRSDSVRLPRRSPGLRMLQQARDEAHRFAVTYNRKRRSLRTVTSELLSIPGIGPSKRRALIQTFGSVQGVRDATVEQIAALPGFSPPSARKLLASLGVARADPPVDAADPVPAVTDTEQATPVDAADATEAAVPQPNDAAPVAQDPPAVPHFPRTPDTL
jgi:excinuclease ABC subunit C